MSGDTIGGGGFREGRGEGGGREGASCWKGLQTAQTVGVHQGSSTAWPGRIPTSHSFLRSTRSDYGGGDVIKTHLVFLFPVENIFDPAKAAHIDVFSWLEKRFRREDDKATRGDLRGYKHLSTLR